jgi:hypothetical protein
MGVCADSKQGKPRVVDFTLEVELRRAGFGRIMPRNALPILSWGVAATVDKRPQKWLVWEK